MNAKEKRSVHKEIREELEESSRRRQARLLVIEDDDEIREALQLLLGGKYDLVGLSDGARILDMIDGHEPDLVILDVNLPGKLPCSLVQVRGFEIPTPFREALLHNIADL